MLRTLVLALTLTTASPLFAGDLTPPASVTPSMKTLDQIEPRIPVGPLTTPGDADSVYRIDQPGSYFLTGDVVGAVGKHGVEIVVPDVEFDLGGFTLRGVAGSLNGININVGPNLSNIRIRNGAIQGFGGDGLSVGSGVAANGPPGVIERISAVGNGGLGIEAFNAAVVDCFASENGGVGFRLAGDATAARCSSIANTGAGFRVGPNSIVSDCVARENQVHGFWHENASGGRILRDCIADRNVFSGFVFASDTVFERCVAIGDGPSGAGEPGFKTTGDGNRFVDCISRNSSLAGFYLYGSASLEGCVAEGSAAEGFLTLGSSLLTGCTARDNGGFGFSGDTNVSAIDCISDENAIGFNFSSRALLQNCAARSNASSGIQVGDGSRIEGCLAVANGATGIWAGADSAIVDSTANQNAGGGIGTTIRSTIRRCEASYNQSATTNVPGVNLSGGFNRVEDCAFIQNDGPAVSISGNRNILVRNTLAFNNGSISVISGSSNLYSNSSDPATAGPWQNITH
jgi:hypothetical protein